MRHLFIRMLGSLLLFSIFTLYTPALAGGTCSAALKYCKEECRNMYSSDYLRSFCYGGCFIGYLFC